MFLGYQNEKIVLVAQTREALENISYIHLDRIEYTPAEYVSYHGQYIPKTIALQQESQRQHAAEVNQLQQNLEQIDLQTIRALRAVSAGLGNEEDRTKLAQLEQQAVQLRAQLKELA